MTQQDKLVQILYVPPSDVKINGRFRKEIGSLEDIKKSILEIGLLQPIGITNDYILVFGERRLQAWKELTPDEPIPCIVVNGDLYKLKLAELHENVKRSNMDWKDEVLAIEEIKQTYERLYGWAQHGGDRKSNQVSSDETCFSQPKLACEIEISEGKLSQDLQLAKALKEYPEIRKAENKSQALYLLKRLETPNQNSELLLSIPFEVSIKRGQIFKLHNHKVMCGDATNSKDVLALMGDEKADIVFTDPPFNVGVDYETYKDRNPLYWEQLVKPAFYLMNDLAKDNASFYVKQFFANSFKMSNILQEIGLKFKNLIIWKNQSQAHPIGNYDVAFEVILFFVKGNPIFNAWAEKRDEPLGYWSGVGKEFKGKMSNLWDDIKRVWTGASHSIEAELKNESNIREHPTQMPIGLAKRGILFSSQENDLVIDFFGGSGTTLLAAEETNRRCYMMDVEPIFCQLSINRWEKMTGKKAEKLV